jgi:hypothetical protein
MRTVLSEPKPWGEQIPTQLCYTVRLQQNAQVCMHPNTSAAIICHQTVIKAIGSVQLLSFSDDMYRLGCRVHRSWVPI